MPFDPGHLVSAALHRALQQEGVTTRARSAAIRASGEVVNIGAAIASAGIAAYSGGTTLQGWLDHAADAVAGLPANVVQAVFGKAGVSDAQTHLTDAQESAIAKATGGALRFIRKYTNQPGALDIVSSKPQPIINTGKPDVGLGQWFHVDGLAPDEVFLIQRIRYVVGVEEGSDNRFMGFLPFRPHGFFDRSAMDHWQPEGEDYNLDLIGVHNSRQFFDNAIAVVVLGRNDTGNTNPSRSNIEVDFSPNFIPIRSYQVWRSLGLVNELWKVELFGHKVKWLLPLEAAF